MALPEPSGPIKPISLPGLTFILTGSNHYGLQPGNLFMQLIRMVLLKGSEIQHVARHFIVISIMAVTTLGVTVFTYRKRA